MLTQILLPLVTYPTPNSDAVAANAVNMAANLNGTLHALALDADIPVVTNAMSNLILDVPKLVREVEDLSKQRGDHLLAEVKNAADAIGLEVTTQTLLPRMGFLHEAAAVRARYFDYVLYGWEAGNDTGLATAETLIFQAGRPTILLPELREITQINHVAIAWDGGRAASRAASDARYLIHKAKQVTVVAVTGEKPIEDDLGPERLVAHLGAKGINAKVAKVHYSGSGISGLLQETALNEGAEMLVMGAFGHSRFREFVLGGATREILLNLQLPALLAH